MARTKRYRLNHLLNTNLGNLIENLLIGNQIRIVLLERWRSLRGLVGSLLGGVVKIKVIIKVESSSLLRIISNCNRIKGS